MGRHHHDSTTVVTGAVRVLGERIRERRRARGLTIVDFARQLNMSPTTLGAIERGSLDASIGRTFAVAAALGMPLLPLD